MLDKFSYFCHLLTFFKLTFLKKIQEHYKSVSNDPNQDRRFVGPELDPNCLQRASANDKTLLTRKEYK